MQNLTKEGDMGTHKYTRRRTFLRLTGVAAAGLLVEGCKAKGITIPPASPLPPATAEITPTRSPTLYPTPIHIDGTTTPAPKQIEEPEHPVDPTATPKPTEAPEPTEVSEYMKIVDGKLQQWNATTNQFEPVFIDGNPIWASAIDGIGVSNFETVLHTVFDDNGNPVAVWDLEAGRAVPAGANEKIDEKGEIICTVLGSGPYTWNGQNWTDAFYRSRGTNLQAWSGERYKGVHDKNGEIIKAEQMMWAEGGWIAVYNDRITARMTNHQDVETTENGTVDRGDGWRLAWNKVTQAVEYAVQTRPDGFLYMYKFDHYEMFTDAAGIAVAAKDIVPAGDFSGWVAVNGQEMTAYLDNNGNLMAAFNGEIALGWKVCAYKDGQLTELGKNWFEWMEGRPGHNSITVDTEKLPGLGITVILNETAFHQDLDLYWNKQELFIRYWLEAAYARMKDEGTLPEEISNWAQLRTWLQEGNQIILKQVSAWNTTTGKVELMENIKVRRIKVYLTEMDQVSSGEPPLPMDNGKARYASNITDTAGRDIVYNPTTNDLWLVVESSKESQAINSFYLSRKCISAGVLFRVPWSVLESNILKDKSRGGRILYNTTIVDRLLTNMSTPLIGRESLITVIEKK